MRPVTSTQSGDFWLKKHVSSTETSVNFTNVSTLEAHTPYLIAFPGTHWGREFPTDWNVTFSGTGAEFDMTKSGTTTSEYYHYKGNYDNLKDDATTAAYYILDSEQNKFIKEANQSLKPFHSYFIDAVTMANSKIRSLSIGNGTDGATSLIALDSENNASFTVESSKREVIIHINKQSEIKIYNMNGQILYQDILEEGSKRISLERGIYILNDNKVIVY